MYLLQQLNEASSLSVDEVKKILSKDKYGKLALKKDLTLDEIDNKESFLSTIKYYLLNNPAVLQFVKSRSGVKDLSEIFFKEVRQIRVQDLTQEKLNYILHNVQAVFKEHKSAHASSMTPSTRKDLTDWVNGNIGYHSLPKSSQKELLSLPNIRPQKAIRLYRGILFSKYSLQSREKYDGTLERGSGLKFLDAVRKNGKEVDLTWDKASSWTTSRDVAERFARFAPQSSNYAATMNWLSRGNKFIDGDLGFVVSTLARPEDILVDLSMLSKGLTANHGDEGEVILSPGTYHSRIVNKYSVEGEVDLKADTSRLTLSLEKLEQDAASLKKKYDLSIFSWYNTVTIYNLFNNLTHIKMLMSNETTDLLHHAYDAYRDFYIKDIKSFMSEYNGKAVDSNTIEKIQKIKYFQSHFNEKSKHSKSESKDTIETLNYSEYRTLMNPVYGTKFLEKDLVVSRRISRDAMDAFEKIAKFGGVDVPKNFHILGAPKQKDVIESTINKFIDKLNLEHSDSYESNAKTVINIFRRITRNFSTISMIRSFQNSL